MIKRQYESVTTENESLKRDYAHLRNSRKCDEKMMENYDRELKKQMNMAEERLWEIKTMYEKERAGLNAKLVEEKEQSELQIKQKERELNKKLESERINNQNDLKNNKEVFEREINIERSKSEKIKAKMDKKNYNSNESERPSKSSKQMIDLLKQKDGEIYN